ncbi:MAG: radical SAM protein [Gammaproteobacteria bacterium]
MSNEPPAGLFTRFVDTFVPGCRPEVLAMSGGEAMLRPKLVRQLAERATEVGTRATALSGLFFARSRQIPPAIKVAIKALHHFSASIDVFHEREVPRTDVFRVLESVLNEGIDVSLHVVGQHAADPYLDDLIDDVQRAFNSRVPMLVNVVSYFGRARSWLSSRKSVGQYEIEANPCAMAAWPVVGWDGTIVACGNDDALYKVPAHLRLGHASTDDWATVRTRTLASKMMRAIRLFGPEYLADRHLDGAVGCNGYCNTCMKLSGNPAIQTQVQNLMAKPSTAVIEEQVSALQRRAGALAFARRYGVPRYAELAALGAPA